MRPFWKNVKHSVGLLGMYSSLNVSFVFSIAPCCTLKQPRLGWAMQHPWTRVLWSYTPFLGEDDGKAMHGPVSLSLSLSCSVLPRLLYSSWPLHNRTQIEIVFRRKHRAFLSLVHTPTESQPAPCIRPPSHPPAGRASCVYTSVVTCLCVCRRQRRLFQDDDALHLYRIHILTHRYGENLKNLPQH